MGKGSLEKRLLGVSKWSELRARRDANEDNKVGAYDLLAHFKTKHQKMEGEFSRVQTLGSMKRPSRGQRLTMAINGLLRVNDDRKKKGSQDQAEQDTNNEIKTKRRRKSVFKPPMVDSKGKSGKGRCKPQPLPSVKEGSSAKIKGGSSQKSGCSSRVALSA